MMNDPVTGGARLHALCDDHGPHAIAHSPLLAGLEWSTGRQPSASAWAGRRAAALCWRGSRTMIDATALDDVGPTDTGSLLAQMCLAVEREKQQAGHGEGEGEGLWLNVARVRSLDTDDTIRWWLGGTEGGCPSHTVPEELFDTIGDLMRALSEIAATSPLGGIVVAASSSDRLLDAIEAHGPEIIPLPCTVVPLPVGSPDGAGPMFQDLPRRRGAMVAAAAVGFALLTVGLGWYGGLFDGPTAPQPDITFAEPVDGAVRGGCLAGLTGVWPRMPGWTIADAGCARTGYLPDGLKASAKPAGNVIVWRTYDRDPAANAVLAGAAADRLIARHGQGPSRGHVQPADGADQVVLWRGERTDMQQVAPGGFLALDDVERTLSQVFAEAPGAVSVDGNLLNVTVTDPPHRAIRRLDGIGQPVDLLSVVRRDGRTVLRLRPGRRPHPENAGGTT